MIQLNPNAHQGEDVQGVGKQVGKRPARFAEADLDGQVQEDEAQEAQVGKVRVAEALAAEKVGTGHRVIKVPVEEEDVEVQDVGAIRLYKGCPLNLRGILSLEGYFFKFCSAWRMRSLTLLPPISPPILPACSAVISPL